MIERTIVTDAAKNKDNGVYIIAALTFITRGL